MFVFYYSKWITIKFHSAALNVGRWSAGTYANVWTEERKETKNFDDQSDDEPYFANEINGSAQMLSLFKYIPNYLCVVMRQSTSETGHKYIYQHFFSHER
jgi:hypothetical protein